MADVHEEHEGPIHQAPWVFYLTVAACYGALGLIMFGKFATDDIEVSDLATVFGVQAGVLTVFLVLFGVFFYVANKLIGATDPDE